MTAFCSPSTFRRRLLLLLLGRGVAVELGVVDARRAVDRVRRRLVVPPRLRRDDERLAAAAAAAERLEGGVARPRVAAAPHVRPLPVMNDRRMGLENWKLVGRKFETVSDHIHGRI